MPRQRRHFTPEQKVALLRLHLLEKRPISDICQEHDLSVTLFYLWQKQFFENGTAAFDNPGKRRKAGQDIKDRKIAVGLASAGGVAREGRAFGRGALLRGGAGGCLGR